MHVAGGRWFRRPEFHVTTFNPEALVQATGLAVHELARAAAQLHGELTMTRPLRFDGRVCAVSESDGRATLVAFCDVDGIEEIYQRLSALAGRELPRPPTHVTLYTSRPGMDGIGLSTQRDVAEKALALPATDAQSILARLRVRAARG